ncbi:hypothetical protein V2I01_18275 [Micromonospora sp. BRA006-A]|nr:hypothetical protein [Micromonospora sp. BRA006-A]
MLDYVLTVSVSVAAGVHAVTSALPGLDPWAVPLGVLVIVVLLAGNLRGVRTAGNIFVLPTYAFVVVLVAVLAIGYAKAASRVSRRCRRPRCPPPRAWACCWCCGRSPPARCR